MSETQQEIEDNAAVNEETVLSTPTEESSSLLPPRWAHWMFWPIVVVGVAADLWTKHAVHDWLWSLPNREYSAIDGFLQFVIRNNSGAAWSIAQGQRALLVGVSAVALAVVVGIFLFGRVRQRLMVMALGLFTGGIIGNLYDRVFNDGYVRDWIDVYWRGHHWPAFNIADSMLCIGVALMLISSFTYPSHRTPTHPQR